MKKVFRANLYFLIIILLEIIMPFFIGPIYKVLGITDIRVSLVVTHCLLFIVPAITYILVTKSGFKKTLRLNKLYLKDALFLILIGILCQPLMMFFSIIASFFFNNDIGVFMNEIMETPYLILLGIVALLPSITEEVTIRGVVLTGYDGKNKYVTAAITGLFFGIFHLDPQQFLYATVIGFILAIVVRNTNTIFAGSLVHFVINGTSITLQKLLSNGPEVADVSLKALPLILKAIFVVFYGGLALGFGALIFLIIRKLEEWNIKRGVITKEMGSTSNERILNWPLVAIIIVYIAYMGITISLRAPVV